MTNRKLYIPSFKTNMHHVATLQCHALHNATPECVFPNPPTDLWLPRCTCKIQHLRIWHCKVFYKRATPKKTPQSYKSLHFHIPYNCRPQSVCLTGRIAECFTAGNQISNGRAEISLLSSAVLWFLFGSNWFCCFHFNIESCWGRKKMQANLVLLLFVLQQKFCMHFSFVLMNFKTIILTIFWGVRERDYFAAITS